MPSPYPDYTPLKYSALSRPAQKRKASPALVAVSPTKHKAAAALRPTAGPAWPGTAGRQATKRSLTSLQLGRAAEADKGTGAFAGEPATGLCAVILCQA